MKKINTNDITRFSRQLATLLNAGITIVQALNLLARGHSKVAMQKLIQALKKHVELGRPVAEALHYYPKQFSALYCSLISIGELSGNLDYMFEQIAFYQEKSATLKRKIQKALFYPITIIGIAFLVTAAMLIFIVPQFTALFTSFGAALPPATRFIIKLSEWLQHFGWSILLFFSALFILIRWFIKRSSVFAYKVDLFILKLPLIKNILTKAIIARFTRTLATTFAAGLPLADALQATASSANNKVYSHAILRMRERLIAGQTLQRALQETRLFPQLMIQMVTVGEESGTLETMLNKIASMFESDVDHVIDNLSNLLEPVIMIILGIVIGGLIIAMYLPIFKLGSVI
jgi:type IV pilus assembly protein PilC